MAEALQRRISAMAPDLRFAVDQESGQVVITVTDPVTNEVIRKIPSDEMLRLGKALERMQGLLIDRQA